MLNLARLNLQVEHHRAPDLVHGDIVNFEAVGRAPADGPLLRVGTLEIEESA